MRISDEERAELKRLRLAKRAGQGDPTARIRLERLPRRRQTQHEKAVIDLCAALGLRRKGFRKAVHAALCWDAVPLVDEDDDGPEVELGTVPWDDVADLLSIRPDAFQIVGKEAHCYEVVHTCILDSDRRSAYAQLSFAFDTWGGTIRLWVCDIYGNRGEQDLMQWWISDHMPRLIAARAE